VADSNPLNRIRSITDHLHLTRSAELETLGVLRDFIAQTCARRGIDGKTL
jgi:hypothetical protein